jgi:diguanylate cyclase
MSLQYDLDSRLKDLTPALQDCTEWFMQLVRHVSYPGKTKAVGKPASLGAWIDAAERDKFQPEVIKKLKSIYRDLVAQAESLAAQAGKTKAPPEYKDFDKLITCYEEFIDHVRRLERDCLLENSGLDPLTGLRSTAVIRKDFKREMERLARQGKPFSLALVKIDNLDSSDNDESIKEAVRAVAGLIMRSLRTFDDAYRLENNEFMLALKQADMTGGIQALERLRKELIKQDAEIVVKGKKTPLTLTSCIAEPMPGDEFDDLLDNLRVDLAAIGKDDGAVFEYMEMSPQQRYLKKGQE